MKSTRLICLASALMFIIVGCKKEEPVPAQQAEVKTKERPAEPPTGDVPPSPGDRPAPSFTLQDLNGKQVSLSDFKGKVVILDFWATWCGPCVMEVPHFVALYEQYKDKGFAMVGISVDRGDVGVVRSFVEKYRVDYPILMTSREVEKAFGDITSIPTAFVIDSAGNIRRTYVGYRDKAVFEADIKTLLAEAEARN